MYSKTAIKTILPVLFCGWAQAAHATSPITGYDFENGTSGWATADCSNCGASWAGSGAGQDEVGPTFEGHGSLKVYLGAAGSSQKVSIYNPSYNDGLDVGSAQYVTYAVWFPSGASGKIGAVQAFAQTSGGYSRFYMGGWALPDDGWVIFTTKIPFSQTDTKLLQTGLFIDCNSALENSIYIDAIKFH